MKTLIIDGNSMAYRNVFASVKLMPEDNEEFYFWRHIMMQNILEMICKFEPDRVVLVFDTKSSWRKNIYSEYKAHRKDNRDKSPVNFEKFYPVMTNFQNDIREAFSSFYVLSLSGCEGDDIIAILIREKFFDDDVIIISSDTDMHQLIDDNVKQYDIIKQQFHNSMNPKLELDIKILTGDRSDNIKPIRAKIGPVTAEKILNEGLYTFLNDNPELMPNWEMNRTLIDFNFIPDYIRKTIINTYDGYVRTRINSNTMIKFLTLNKLKKIMDDMGMYDKYLDRLNGDLQGEHELSQGRI